MKANSWVKLWTAGILTFFCGASFGQGQIAFNTRVVGVVDAPAYLPTGGGPGPDYTAQLFLVSGSSLTPLFPATTFRDGSNDPIMAQYVNPVDVIVPGLSPGTTVTVRLQFWLTAAGSYDNSLPRGGSTDIRITLGGGLLPPANLENLLIISIPEPSLTALALLGLSVGMLYRRGRG